MLLLVQKYWKALAVVFLLLGAFSTGWIAKSMKDDHEENIQLKQQQAVSKAVKEATAQIKEQNAQQYLENKKYLESQQYKIIKEKTETILQNKIYTNQCLDGAGVDSLTEMRENSRKARGLDK